MGTPCSLWGENRLRADALIGQRSGLPVTDFWRTRRPGSRTSRRTVSLPPSHARAGWLGWPVIEGPDRKPLCLHISPACWVWCKERSGLQTFNQATLCVAAFKDGVEKTRQTECMFISGDGRYGQVRDQCQG